MKKTYTAGEFYCFGCRRHLLLAVMAPIVGKKQPRCLDCIGKASGTIPVRRRKAPTKLKALAADRSGRFFSRVGG